jgi:hypothetical protein
LRRWSIFALALLLAAITVAVFLVMAEPEAPDRTAGWKKYTLPVAPPFLAENVAMAHALRALADSGTDTSLWVAVKVEQTQRTRAPDGTRDIFLFRMGPNVGTIRFRHSDSTNSLRTIHLQLGRDDIWCSVR